MPKRKHGEITGSETRSSANDDTKARALRLHRLHLDGLLDQASKSLFRSLKVARGFERQKLGRRQKTAKNAPDGNATDRDTVVARLEAEVAALKGLDLAATAEMYLYRSLLKIKSVAEADALPRYVRDMVERSRKRQEVASKNVQARLFRSGPVRGAMMEAVRGIRGALGVEGGKADRGKRLRARDYEDGERGADRSGLVGLGREGSLVSEGGAQDEDDKGGFSTLESPDQETKNKPRDDEHEGGDEDEGINYDIYATRLAASPSSALAQNPNGQNHNRLNPDNDDMSITTEEEEYHPTTTTTTTTINSPETKPLPPPRTAHPPKNQKPTSTTFLPSLSLAGYYSGTDSDDASSPFPNTDTNTDRPTRKNRMGQQARRALWERKYGREANHVKRKKRVERRGENGERRKRTGANEEPVGGRKARLKEGWGEKGEKGTSLHPSWEAARKAKEKEARGTVGAFLGKKVVFE